jgi:sigma54-dependent transcription regulator
MFELVRYLTGDWLTQSQRGPVPLTRLVVEALTMPVRIEFDGQPIFLESANARERVARLLSLIYESNKGLFGRARSTDARLFDKIGGGLLHLDSVIDLTIDSHLLLKFSVIQVVHNDYRFNVYPSELTQVSDITILLIRTVSEILQKYDID